MDRAFCAAVPDAVTHGSFASIQSYRQADRYLGRLARRDGIVVSGDASNNLTRRDARTHFDKSVRCISGPLFPDFACARRITSFFKL